MSKKRKLSTSLESQASGATTKPAVDEMTPEKKKRGRKRARNAQEVSVTEDNKDFCLKIQRLQGEQFPLPVRTKPSLDALSKNERRFAYLIQNIDMPQNSSDAVNTIMAVAFGRYTKVSNGISYSSGGGYMPLELRDKIVSFLDGYYGEGVKRWRKALISWRKNEYRPGKMTRYLMTFSKTIEDRFYFRYIYTT